MQRLFGQALLEPLKVIVCLSIAAWISWRLLLLTILIAPLAGYSIHWLGKALKRTHKKAMQELSMIYETLSETLGGIKLIKAFTMEPAERNKFEKSAETVLPTPNADRHLQCAREPRHRNAGHRDRARRRRSWAATSSSASTRTSSASRSATSPLTHGDMSIFFAMLAGMSDPARRLSGEFSNIQQAIAAADRVYEVLDREPTIVDPPNPVALPVAQTFTSTSKTSVFQYHADKPDPPRRQPRSSRRRNDRHRRPQRLRQNHAHATPAAVLRPDRRPRH